ncbi:hypothetical protein BGZ58_010527 [Dissophora ornata]|nr:hypothetical protein BGZ58_010527 [Dissophora ornata]
MAVLGDFDALTPVISAGQQNTFESNTFSILELTRIPTNHRGISNSSSSGGNNNSQVDMALSAPVLLASFSMDSTSTSTSSAGNSTAQMMTQNNGITATCVLDRMPHQVYIGGYFKQVPSTNSYSNNSNSTSSGSTPTTSSPKINYIGLYDSKLKRFLPMGSGLDGPVQDLWCDSETDQVYIVGKFRAPLQDEMTSGQTSGNSNNYQHLGSFGGGIAVWKRAQDPDLSSSSVDSDIGSSNGQPGQSHMFTHVAAGSWVSLPFKGVNGVVSSVVKAQDGTFYFGGKFDTTADGESFSAPDTQPVSMDHVMVTTGNGVNASQDQNIICQSTTASGGNWIMQDNIPGYWRAEFPLYITPALFRLWNVDPSSSSNRGTKTFSIMAQPSNQLLNLSYLDPITRQIQYCTVCTLLPRSISTPVHQEYQDFVVATPVLLNAIQIDVLSWYGLGGGLGGLKVYQSEIFVRAVNELNYTPKCAAAIISEKSTQGHQEDNKDMTAYSSFLGADWVVMNMTKGWQTVLAASLSATDAAVRKPAYVDLSPYLQETGTYDVYLYTPACSSSSNAKSDSTAGNNTSGLPSNACAARGSVDVHMYFASPENVITVTLSQTNSVDKYDKIYSGMIMYSTPDFRPHVVVGPSLIKPGASGGGDLQTVIVDSIQFVKQASVNSTNSLLFYRPGPGTGVTSAVAATEFEKVGLGKEQKVQGLDGSTWGNLPKQLPSGAVVNSLATYYGSIGSSLSSSAASLLFIGGDFQSIEYSNVIAWDGTAFIPLGQQVKSATTSGLDGTVSSMTLYQSSLYIVGSFQQSLATNTGTPLPGGLALYDIQTSTWRSFGNVTQNFQPGAQFHSIQLSTGANGQPQLMISGIFKWMQLQTQSASSSIAIWDINNQKWVYDNGQAYSGSNSSSSGSSSSDEFSFGYLHGQISYLNRVPGSSANGTAGVPVVLVAGAIDSLDTYQVRQPENMAWITDSGKLKIVNLSPAISMAVPGQSSIGSAYDATTAQSPIAQSPVLQKTGAGIMYFNKSSQQWVTIVGGTYADASIGAGYFYTPAIPSPTQDTTLSYKNLNLVLALPSSPIVGEILALGLDKDESTGYGSTASGSDLLLIGGAFKSTATGVNGLALYDLTANQVMSSNVMPALRGVHGRDPVVQVIKSQPGGGSLILAGDFSGVGQGVNCEMVCVWSPSEAREALEKKSSLEGSFKSLYGDSDSKKHLGILKGVVNDIAFEDDKNMYVAGDLVVNGISCGVASFNFDSSKWTTFGSMMNATNESGVTTHPPGPDALTGPVTAIAHDSTFHRFFIAGSEVHRLEILPASKDAPLRTATSASVLNGHIFNNDFDTNNNDINNPISSETTSMPKSPAPSPSEADADPNDTINILEQGFILLVSGRIVLGNPSAPAAALDKSDPDHHESSLAFFDGQSWYPYLQSSRNSSSFMNTAMIPKPGATTPVNTSLDPGGIILSDTSIATTAQRRSLSSELATRSVSMTPILDPASSSSTTIGGPQMVLRLRDQGVFRALAIAHLPRVIVRSYLSLPYIILISAAIALGLICLIVLSGFLFVWIKRRVSKGSRPTRPRLGTSFMEDEYGGHLGRNGSGSYLADKSMSEKGKGSMFFGGSKKKAGPENSSAILAALGISEATLDDPRYNGNYTANSYRPNSTILEATDALVTAFVRSHSQQLPRASDASLPQQYYRQDDDALPPSPDRHNKKSRHSVPQKVRDSSGSELTNTLSQGGAGGDRRFSSMLLDPNNNNNPPTSPATTMTTPGGVIGITPTTASGASGGGSMFYYAKYPFRAREIGELGFKTGERILVVDMSDDVWWMGVIQDALGQQMHGVFPSNYVGPTP